MFLGKSSMSSPEHDKPADDEIAMRCLRRGWRRRRLGDEVFVFDEKARLTELVRPSCE